MPPANRLDGLFEDRRSRGEKTLIGYITAGHPNKASLAILVQELGEAGLDIIEIGVPFSDPIADGPTIQKSSQLALANGVTLHWVLGQIRELRSSGITTPLVLMTYSNLLVSLGLPLFFKQAKESGVDGIIIPDIIPEEGDMFEKPARDANIHVIYMAAPTSPDDRLRMISKATQGFLYAVSVAGVTGARAKMGANVMTFLRRLRKMTTKPIAVGFGVSSPEHVRVVRSAVDGVIVGSALILEIGKAKGNNFVAAKKFVTGLKTALNPKSSASSKENAHAS